ncbi:hypothetical protein [Spirosoma horti]
MERQIYYKKNSFDIVLLLLSIYFIMSYLSLFYVELRYLKYALPAVSGAFFLYRTGNAMDIYNDISNKYISFFLKFYCIIFLVFFLIQISQYTLSFRFFANCFFVLLPALFVYFIIPFIRLEKINYYFKFICLFTVLGYIIEKHDSILMTVLNWKQLLLGLEDSSVASESNIYPFLLAFIFLYSFYYKFSWIQTLIILFFVLLSFKRIVILGIIMFMCLRIVPYLYSKAIRFPNASSFAFSCFALAIITLYYYIANGYFDDYLYSKFGLYTNALLQGRQVFYEIAIKNNNNMFIGSGIGSIDNLLVKHSEDVGNSANLHSELLRWFLETGIFSYFIWMYVFFKNSLKTHFSLLLFFFLFILLLTDNVFIYFDCMFYVYILGIFSIFSEMNIVNFNQVKVNKDVYIPRLETQPQ